MPFQGLPLTARVITWFLFLSYIVGGPVSAMLEFFANLLSQRFVYPPEFIYFIGVVQFACSLLLLSPRTRLWSLIILTVISVGAVASHLRINSPLTAIPALGYTVLQLWLARYAHREGQGRGKG